MGSSSSHSELRNEHLIINKFVLFLLDARALASLERALLQESLSLHLLRKTNLNINFTYYNVNKRVAHNNLINLSDVVVARCAHDSLRACIRVCVYVSLCFCMRASRLARVDFLHNQIQAKANVLLSRT